jgi:diaminohydroxyphosphoribosylaminopyrimidine deaminase/5-amino-6-(5-phosphoribosylamino)uracil reductase
MRRGLVDELVVYLAATLMGSTARPLFELPLDTMAGKLELKITDVSAVGDDWKITAVPDKEA